jgi:ribosome recycling factor
MEKLKKTEKEEHISEDERKHGETELQKLTDNHTKEIYRLVESKEKEVMEV